MPIHPEVIAFSHETSIMPEAIMKVQNNFTIVLLGLGLCVGKEVDELDIFKNGKISLTKVREQIEKASETHPRSSRDMVRILKGGEESKLKFKEFQLIIKKDRKE